jgi:hypothetical protein
VSERLRSWWYRPHSTIFLPLREPPMIRRNDWRFTSSWRASSRSACLPLQHRTECFSDYLLGVGTFFVDWCTCYQKQSIRRGTGSMIPSSHLKLMILKLYFFTQCLEIAVNRYTWSVWLQALWSARSPFPSNVCRENLVWYLSTTCKRTAELYLEALVESDLQRFAFAFPYNLIMRRSS